MDFAIVVLMRMSSSRLPNKPFMNINGKLVADIILENVGNYASKNKIIFAISDAVTDDPLANYLEFRGVNVYRGPENDVLSRFISACETVNADWYIRYNGDNIFHNPENFSIFNQLKNDEKLKIISNTQPRSLPKGITFEAVRSDLLKEIQPSECSEYEQEHVFPAFYGRVSSEEIYNISHDIHLNGDSVNLSLDFVQDVIFLKSLQNRPYSCKTDAIEGLVASRRKFGQNNPFIGKNGIFTIAEIGGNHEGDYNYAKKLIEEAIQTDVDCIKLQIYTPDLIVNPVLDPDRNSHFKKFALASNEYIALLELIRSADKIAMASVWSVQELEYYAPYLDYLKIGSGDFNDTSILEKVCTLNKPIVISAGLSSEKETLRIYNYLTQKGVKSEAICLLQCTSMYPIPFAEANLGVLERLKYLLPEATIGYSDHTVGQTALMASVPMGAQVLEFHFTDDKTNSKFRDHLVSLEQADVTHLVKWIRELYVLSGSKVKSLSPSELSSGHSVSFRKAVFPKRKLLSGHVLTADDLITLRPSVGWSAERFNELLGRKLANTKERYSAIDENDIE